MLISKPRVTGDALYIMLSKFEKQQVRKVALFALSKYIQLGVV